MLHFSVYEIENYSSFSKKDLASYESEIGQKLCKELLRAHFGIENPVFKRNEFGKPYIDKENVFFNISHSLGIVVCVVSDEPCGIDVERLVGGEKSDFNRLADRFFCQGEKSYFSAHDCSASAFYYIWTRKEALSKCLGTPFMSSISYDSTSKDLDIRTNLYDGYVVSIATNIQKSIDF